ncbi:hypothetical protein EON65_39600 [archaeon]|nr:MAG: hypothetical protein EON65_39600 [archaeon]
MYINSLTITLFDTVIEHTLSSATPAKVIDSAAVEKLTDESREELLVHAFGEVGDLQDGKHILAVQSY